MIHSLEPLDADYVNDVLSHPPFVTVPGVINVRDLGSYPSVKYADQCTKSGFVFRSAELSSITAEGMSLILFTFTAR